MRPILRSSLTVLVLIGAVWLASHRVGGDEGKIARKIDETTAQRLVAEAVYGVTRDLEFFDFDSSISTKFTPPFLAFEGLTMPPAEGIFGVFAVNPWTGDVWALWDCHKLSSPALRKSQAMIKRHLNSAELRRYAELRGLKPQCVVED